MKFRAANGAAGKNPATDIFDKKKPFMSNMKPMHTVRDAQRKRPADEFWDFKLQTMSQSMFVLSSLVLGRIAWTRRTRRPVAFLTLGEEVYTLLHVAGEWQGGHGALQLSCHCALRPDCQDV